MQITMKEIGEAKDWLTEQRAVVHPGPIETIRAALDYLEAGVGDREDADAHG